MCEPMQCELDDVNKICTKRCTPEELRRWCPRKETSKEKKEGEVCCCACLLLVDCARSTEKTYCHVKSQGKVLIGAWIAKGGEEGGQRKRQRERERGRDRERIARAASLHARR